MRLRIAEIPKSKWNSLHFISLKEQILVSHRKIQKGVDLGIERERFINACNTIQKDAFGSAASVHTIDFTVNLKDLLMTPILNIEDCSFLKKLKIDHLDEIGGFIISTDVFYGDLKIETVDLQPKISFLYPQMVNSLDDVGSNRNSLTEKIQYAFLSGEPIGSANKLIRHSKLISEIRDFVFVEKDLPDEKPFVRFAYEDGSIGEAFPLFCLPKIDKPIASEQINVGLISNRHHELDNFIDYYLIRNSEISKVGEVFIAEQEQIAFKKTYDFLKNSIRIFDQSATFQFNLYHTGLEAAVIGAYRAIIKVLLDSSVRGKIIFKPFITEKRHLMEWY